MEGLAHLVGIVLDHEGEAAPVQPLVAAQPHALMLVFVVLLVQETAVEQTAKHRLSPLRPRGAASTGGDGMWWRKYSLCVGSESAISVTRLSGAPRLASGPVPGPVLL